MAKVDVGIDDYLSEEDKKELAIQVFKDRVEKDLFESRSGTVDSDAEVQRIISNISYGIVMKEVQKHIPNFEQMIKDKTLELIKTKDLSYEVFKKKDVWDAEESLAITYIKQTLNDNKAMLQARIKETIENYDLSNDISKLISETYENIAGSMEKLSELFMKK